MNRKVQDVMQWGKVAYDPSQRKAKEIKKARLIEDL